MKSSGKSTTATTVTYTFGNDHTTPTTTTQIPIDSNSSATPVQVRLPPPLHSVAATTIQSHYKAHLIRKLYKTISSVKSEADALQKLIQRQETVDAIRSDAKEKLRMNEALMGLLLKLDSVPGIDPTVREARRKVSRRIVELQEIVDGICEAKMGSDCYYYDDHVVEWGTCSFDRMMEQMEVQVCEESGGGEEMERFCAHYLGFRCLRRYLRE